MSLSPGAQPHANVPGGCARPPGEVAAPWDRVLRGDKERGWRRGGGAAERQPVPIGAGSPGGPTGAPVRLLRVRAGRPCVRSGVRPRVQTPWQWHEVWPQAGGCAGAHVRTGGASARGGYRGTRGSVATRPAGCRPPHIPVWVAPRRAVTPLFVTRRRSGSPVPGSMAGGGAGRAKRLGTLLSGLLECGAFCGIIFGWASLVYVLKDLKYFGELCQNSPSPSPSPSPNRTLSGTAPGTPSPSLLVPWPHICSLCILLARCPTASCPQCLVPRVPAVFIPTSPLSRCQGTPASAVPRVPAVLVHHIPARCPPAWCPGCCFSCPRALVPAVLVPTSPCPRVPAALQTAAGRTSSSPSSSPSAPS